MKTDKWWDANDKGDDGEREFSMREGAGPLTSTLNHRAGPLASGPCDKGRMEGM